jgi:hypothetical protein
MRDRFTQTMASREIRKYFGVSVPQGLQRLCSLSPSAG